MSKIVIIGAGAMGSAFALPCLDNNHDINIVGTHLENEFIDQLKKNNNLHPGLKTKIPQEIKIFKFEKFDELLKTNVDLIVLGISSKGIEWVADQLSKLYKDVKNELHLVQLMNTEPVWSLLEHQEFVDKLFHVNGHHELLAKLRPQSIEDLSCVLAIIRPSKRHLADSDWNTIRNQVWVQPDNDEYFFKRSHAIAYATAVVVQMNLLCEGIV